MNMAKRISAWWISGLVFILAVVSIFMSVFFPGDFTTNFIANLFATLIGVGIGIPSGQYLEERLSESYKTKRSNYLLNVLRSEISHNKALIEQVISQLTPNVVIFYSLRLGTWKGITSTDLDSFDDLSLVEEISRLYFEFEHLVRKIDAQLQMTYSAVRASTDYPRLKAGIVSAIRTHASTIIPFCDRVLSMLDARLGAEEPLGS